MTAPDPVVAAIAEAQRAHRIDVRHGRYWVVRCQGCSWQGGQPFGFKTSCHNAHETHVAEVVAAAVREAGLAVVELPKPDSLDAWPVLFGNEPESVYAKTNGDVVISGFDTMGSPVARDLGLALLAAADLADRAVAKRAVVAEGEQ